MRIGDAKDVEELIVALDGNAATGEYNWIPAYKDKRLGKFTGTVEGQIVSATYTYRTGRTIGGRRDYDNA